jgi:hypothetical protein
VPKENATAPAYTGLDTCQEGTPTIRNVRQKSWREESITEAPY